MPNVVYKGKALKGGKIVIEFAADGDAENVCVSTFKNAKPHTDLVEAMRALKVHGALLSPFHKAIQVTLPKSKKGAVKRPELSEADKEMIAVSGITITAKGIYILTVQMMNDQGKWINFNVTCSPEAPEGEGAYEYIEDLTEKIAKARLEFGEFVTGKRAPDPQQSLDFPQGDEGEETK